MHAYEEGCCWLGVIPFAPWDERISPLCPGLPTVPGSPTLVPTYDPTHPTKPPPTNRHVQILEAAAKLGEQEWEYTMEASCVEVWPCSI
jgi:hypothetical protein